MSLSPAFSSPDFKTWFQGQQGQEQKAIITPAAENNAQPHQNTRTEEARPIKPNRMTRIRKTHDRLPNLHVSSPLVWVWHVHITYKV
eukprot:3318601-Pyramimonas_sp.AAC.3